MTSGTERDDLARGTERTTKAKARENGIGVAPEGVELPAGDPAKDTGTSFLGVGEAASPGDRPDERDDVGRETPE